MKVLHGARPTLGRKRPSHRWQSPRRRLRFGTMDAPDPNTSQPPGTETEAERQRRLAWEADCITEARAELDAGLYVDAAEIGAWIASIGTDNELPPPPSRRLKPG
jgi:hypothetical protein